MHKLITTLSIATLAIAASLAAALAVPAVAAGHKGGDAVAGKKVFAKCAMCHSVKPGVKRLGPSLSGIIGRKAGTVAGYKYSPAMLKSGVTWTPAKLDSYLADPRGTLPGVKMIFAGLPQSNDRANLIAYLNAQK